VTLIAIMIIDRGMNGTLYHLKPSHFTRWIPSSPDISFRIERQCYSAINMFETSRRQSNCGEIAMSSATAALPSIASEENNMLKEVLSI